jgi:sugar lactone lactonase YvrE
MRKKNCSCLFLTAAVVAAMRLMAVSTHAAPGDIYETNMDLILRFTPTVATPVTFTAGLSNPKGLAFDGSGRLLVTDASAGAVFFYTPPDGTRATFLGNLSSPVGITFDAMGNLFVGEAGNGHITKFTREAVTSVFASGVGQPAGLAFANNGNLFASDFAGGVIYQITPEGTKSSFATGLNLPAGIAFDTAGNLFVANSGTGTIFKFAPNGTKTTFATGLDTPYGLAFEANGALVVSDHGNGSTFRFTPAGDRSVIFSSDFNTPQFVAIEPAVHQLLNISTRGFVEGGDHVLIAGFIVGGIGPVGTTVAIRALGPSLSAAGVSDPLPDPLLGVRDGNGAVVSYNDNWHDAPLTQQIRSDLAPMRDKEAALQLVLRGGAYTAILTTTDGLPGTALLEVYDLQTR